LSLVIDCSVAIAWLMPDEEDGVADEAIRAVIANGADVPGLFFSEVANVLLVNQRRGRLPSALSFLADVLELEIRRDAGSSPEAIAQSLVLAERHGLTVYDATYLELARRLRAPLATLDTALRRAAVEAGVPLFGA